MISDTKKCIKLSFIFLGNVEIIVGLKWQSTLNKPEYSFAVREQSKQLNGDIKVSGLKTLYTGDNLLRIPRIQMWWAPREGR